MTKTKDQIYYLYHPGIDYEKVGMLIIIFGWLFIFLLTILHLLGFIL